MFQREWPDLRHTLSSRISCAGLVTLGTKRACTSTILSMNRTWWISDRSLHLPDHWHSVLRHNGPRLPLDENTDSQKPSPSSVLSEWLVHCSLYFLGCVVATRTSHCRSPNCAILAPRELWVALNGLVVDSAGVNEHFIFAVEEPLRSNVVKSLVLNHNLRLETWMIRMIVAFCNQTLLRLEECKGAPPRVARIFMPKLATNLRDRWMQLGQKRTS